MTDLEKLVELLSGVQAGGVALDHEALKANAVQNEEVAEYLNANGVTVKQMQKPLTVEELYDRQGEIVYLEYVKNKFEEHPYLLTFFGNYYAEFDCYGGQNADFIIADYGYTWRCWANRPTEEERRAAEWMK